MFFFRLSRSGYIRDWRAPPWREPTLKELLSEPIITALMGRRQRRSRRAQGNPRRDICAASKPCKRLGRAAQ